MTIRKYFDSKYKFAEIFDDKTGFYLRTDILDENGKETGVAPFMRSFPALLDIGIMGKCSSMKTCPVGCYQQGLGNTIGKNMPLEFFKGIIDQIKGKTSEAALGGFGNPNEHENFIEIIKYARENGVVPNYTTSGIALTDREIRATNKFCGAVAISWHNEEYTFRSIDRFVRSGMKTNVHFVVGNDSIDEAIDLLKENDFLIGINAVIFLLYKPVGKLKDNNVLIPSDPRVTEFYKLIEVEHPFKCGLDSCHVPGVMNFTTKVLPESISACDAGRFSMYITADGYALPCSFDTVSRRWAVDIKYKTIQSVWDGEVFSNFRKHHEKSCGECKDCKECFGGCSLMAEKINLCERKERSYFNEN
jgi:radical SAM protein with 4Fe4S-binding SPASM domain